MTHKGNILVVEDDAFIALDLEDVLTHYGYTVIGPAATVQHGLELIETHDLDLALLDYSLGTQTSVRLAQKLESLGVPFLYLSGEVNYLSNDRQTPTSPHISKPFRTSILLQELKKLHN